MSPSCLLRTITYIILGKYENHSSLIAHIAFEEAIPAGKRNKPLLIKPVGENTQPGGDLLICFMEVMNTNNGEGRVGVFNRL